MAQLREILRALELGGALRRAEDAKSGIAECIDDACGERSLGPDDGQRDMLGHRERDQLGEGGQRDVLAAGLVRGSRVAGCHEYFLHTRRLRELPGERVFASAGADDEEFHCERD